MQPTQSSPRQTNTYAILALINGGLALLGNCFSLALIAIPGAPFICGTVSGLLSLGAIATGSVGLIQVRRNALAQKGRGFAITGLVLGMVELLVSCLIPLAGTAILAALGIKLGDMILVPAP